MKAKICQECGTILNDKQACREYLDDMIAWDFNDFLGAGKVHHLTVLCYFLQHPSHYSKRGLKRAQQLLKDVIENDLSDKQLYKMESEEFSSEKRDWNVTGTTNDHGSYSPKINWTMTASDIVKDGVSKYPVHVKEWSRSIYDHLFPV